jgi:Zn-dependent membrane protease YugP/tetratricopeptide (TPR) repeat protein
LDAAGLGGASLPPWLYFVLILVSGLLFARWVRVRYRQAFQQYGQVPSHCGLTAPQVARRLLEHADVRGVRVSPAQVFWGHSRHNPLTREITLAQAVYTSSSVAALAIAAHEVGHALQHARGYAFARVRLALVPATYITLLAAVVALVFGPVQGANSLTWVGVAVVGVYCLFHVATVPVEFDASARARVLAVDAGLLQPEEMVGVDRVLHTAGMTYVSRAVLAVSGFVLFALAVWLTETRRGLGLPQGEDSIWLVAGAQCLALLWLYRHRQGAARNAPGPAELNNTGNLLIEQGRLAEAVAAYTRALALNPRLPQAYANRGAAFAGSGQLDEALADLDASVRLDPTSAAAHACRGGVRFRRGEYDAALADYDRARQLAPVGFPAIPLGRADIWLARGQLDEAIREYTQALNHAASRPVALCSRSLAWLLKGDLDLALADAAEAVRLTPGEAVAYNNRGAVLLKQGQYTRAAEDLRTAIRLNPEHPNAYKNLAWLQATCLEASFRNGPDAVANATRALQLGGSTNTAWLEILAAAHAEAGDFDAAIRCQEEYLAHAAPADQVEQETRLELYRARQAFRDRPVGRRPGDEARRQDQAAACAAPCAP